MPDPAWSDFTPEEPATPDWKDLSPAPEEVTIAQVKPTPYEQARLAGVGGGERMGTFGPESRAEVLALPQILKVPGAIAEATGIPQAASDMYADLMRRTGIDPSAGPGVSPIQLDPKGPVTRTLAELGAPWLRLIPPSVRAALQEVGQATIQLPEPGNLGLAPFAGLKPVAAGFGAMALAGVPDAVTEAIEAKTAEERGAAIGRAGVSAGFAGLIGKHLAEGRLPAAAREAARTAIESEVTDASSIQKATEVHGDLRAQPEQGAGEVPAEEGGTRVQPQAAPVEQPAQVLLTPEASGLLDLERQAIDSPVEVTEQLPDGNPFAGKVATIDRASGKILINPREFSGWLQSIPVKVRQLAVRSLLGEERIHLSVTDAMADAYWNGLTALEKAINRRRYVGTWAGDRLASGEPVQLSDTDLGHEAVRFRMQQLARMTPREIVEAVGREKWTLQGITALEGTIRVLRGTLGTEASGIQRAILARVQRNLNQARRTVVASSPAALRKYNPQEIEDRIRTLGAAPIPEFQKDVRSTQEGLTGEAYRVGYSVTNADQVAALKQNALDALARAQQLKAQGQLAGYAAEVMRQQFWREAYEAATGTGSAGYSLKQNPEYKAPFPQAEPAALRKRPQEQPDLMLPPMKPGEVREPMHSTRATPPSEPLGIAGGAALKGKLTAPETAKATGLRPEMERAPISMKALETDLSDHLLTEARPSFAGFVDAVRTKYGPVKRGQLQEMWTKGVWDNLMRMPGRELERLRDKIGLGRELGATGRRGVVLERKPIPDAPPELPAAGQPPLPGMPQPKLGRRPAGVRAIEAAIKSPAMRRRNNAIARIGEKLIAEAETGRRAWRRKEITPEDIGGWRATTEGAFREITGEEVKSPDTLGRILTEAGGVERSTIRRKVREGELIETRGKAPPESVTKRVTALVDKQTGKVHLASTYRKPRVGAMIVDPRRAKLDRPHRPLGEILDRYRPMASILLDEPVQNFHQVFDNVKAFEAEFGAEARAESARQASYEAKFGEPEPEGLQRKTPWETQFEGPLTEDQSVAVLDHLYDEVGEINTPEDVRDALRGLNAAYTEGRLTERDWETIAGYAKAYEAVAAKWPLLEPEQLLDQLVDEVYDKASKAESGEAFTKDFMDSYRQEPVRAFQGTAERPAQAPAATPTARELTTVDPRRLPPGMREALRKRQPVEPAVVPPRAEPARTLPETPESQEWARRKAAEQYPYEPTPEPTPWEAEDDLPAETSGPSSPGALRKRGMRAQEAWTRTVEALTASVARRGVRRDLPRLLSGYRNEASLYANEAADSLRLASGEPLTKPRPRLAEFLTDPLEAIEKGREYLAEKKAMRSEAEQRREAVHVFIAAGKRNKQGVWYADKNMLVDFRNKLTLGELRARQQLQTGNLWERRTAKAWLDYLPELSKTLDYAEANWRDRKMWQTVKAFRQEMKAEIDYENNNGMTVTERDNYYPHRYEGEFWHDNGINFGARRSILGSVFRKKKKWNNLFEAAANGPYIAASMDAADLAQHRISQGRRMLASRLWLEDLKGRRDPDSGQAIGMEPVGIVTRKTVTDPATGLSVQIPVVSSYKVPRLDYKLYYPGQNVKPIAIRKSYHGLVSTLLSPSRIEEFPGGIEALAITGALKHGVILIWDTFHPGRVLQYGASMLGFGEKLGSRGGYAALNFREADLDRAVSQGYISKTAADWAKEPVDVWTSPGSSTQMSRKAISDEMVRNGLNATKIVDSLYKDSIQNIPVVGELMHSLIGPYNRWLFDRFMPGLMVEAAVRSFEKYNEANPGIPIDKLMKDVIRDINTRFGNLGNQGFFRSKTFQDAMQIIMLAPMWQEGLIRSEAVAFSRASGVSYLAGRRGLPYLGTLGSSVFKGLAAYVVLTQMINLITRGQPTWKNEEKGHQWDAWLPIGKHGVWISPMAVFAEVTHDLIRLNEQKPTFREGGMQAIENRMGPIGKAESIIRTGVSPTGEKYTTTMGALKGAAGQLFPAPIAFGTAGRWLLHAAAPSLVSPPQPGAVPRQLMASMTGIKVQAGKSDLQEQTAKAQEWLQQSGLKPQTIAMSPTDEASYSKLRNALRNDDEASATQILAELRKYKTDRDIIKAMKNWSKLPLTGSAPHERLWLQDASNEELESHTRAMEQKQQEYNAFVDFLMMHQQ